MTDLTPPTEEELDEWERLWNDEINVHPFPDIEKDDVQNVIRLIAELQRLRAKE